MGDGVTPTLLADSTIWLYSSFQFRLSYDGELTPVIRKRADIQSPTLMAPGNWQLGRVLRKGVSGLTTVGLRISGVPERYHFGTHGARDIPGRTRDSGTQPNTVLSTVWLKAPVGWISRGSRTTDSSTSTSAWATRPCLSIYPFRRRLTGTNGRQ